MQIKRLVSVLGIIVVMLTIAARGSGGGHPSSIARAAMTLSGTDSDAGFYQLVNLTGAASRWSESGLRGFTHIQGLAFDMHSNTLYGMSTSPNPGQLITIDPVTGAGTAAGVLGFSHIRGLAFDAKTIRWLAQTKPATTDARVLTMVSRPAGDNLASLAGSAHQ